MSLASLPQAAVSLQATAADWREAVRLAGEALVAAGMTEASYTDRMIAMVEEYGPYIVITPGLALAHARPGRDVLSDGVSVVTLAQPVDFGHAHNDPVRVVVGLAATSADDHVGGVAALAAALDDPGAVERLAQADGVEAVRRVLDPAKGMPAGAAEAPSSSDAPAAASPGGVPEAGA